jgi:hypothetical protein
MVAQLAASMLALSATDFGNAGHVLQRAFSRVPLRFALTRASTGSHSPESVTIPAETTNRPPSGVPAAASNGVPSTANVPSGQASGGSAAEGAPNRSTRSRAPSWLEILLAAIC